MRYLRTLLLFQLLIGWAFASPKCSLKALSAAREESSSQVDVVGCLSKESEKLKLTDDDGNVYYLIGQAGNLRNKVGDELDITGVQPHPPIAPSQYSAPETTLTVNKIETVVHQHRSGVPPILPAVAAWDVSTNGDFGVSYRYPKTFERTESWGPNSEPNFVDQAGSKPILLESRSIPSAIYPDSNFEGGSFAVFVNPGIHSQGTCTQFTSFVPKQTAVYTVQETHYARTESSSVGAGHVSSIYFFHTFKNGFCYEFNFAIEEHNTTGMMLPCSTHWVTEQNYFEFMNAFLSEVRFIPPMVKPEIAKTPDTAPKVVSFEHSQVTVDIAHHVEVSWATEGADYVQLHYVCVKNLYVSDMSEGGNLGCGSPVERNYPASGSASLFLDNLETSDVQFVVTVQPFFAGKSYPHEARTMTMPIPSDQPSERKEIKK